MLSITPLRAAIKRRNSKVHRDSNSTQSTLALPGVVRRFSSAETLNPHLLQPPSAPNVATVTRRSSLSRRIRKVSAGTNQIEATDTCTILDMHIAQIKRKLADFREEDVEISERVEELTNSLSDLCLNYCIPLDSTQTIPYPDSYPFLDYNLETVPTPTDSNSDGDHDNDEFHYFCQTHSHLLRHPYSGYNTLPLPRPPAPAAALTRSRGSRGTRGPPTGNHPQRSQSYDDRDKTKSPAPFQQKHQLSPRKSYPQDANCQSRPQDKEYQFRTSYQDSSHRPRPLSYQEISYDENDYEESSSLDESWNELSCL